MFLFRTQFGTPFFGGPGGDHPPKNFGNFFSKFFLAVIFFGGRGRGLWWPGGGGRCQYAAYKKLSNTITIQS